ncbi:probable E3 ubiquitin ligase SUD1 [Papaver somniferum]|uniref:probable E3 ubiquitin ligase SUD1 n=1 Tax=Papaver somniferum TaxID=3469 RepID=UPI000E701250|nr:probable E3 ubiquitin ligase SUD1 [Papaver somniferum]XP_026444745.1 probable E3 ubiquitin ligase SUD1 [Papaver somniferum]XP_026444746.1 probable E3 ubiquitin ligase SUD1 [Papaver somniferum]XP_026444747.1 probable E3 ubiquitin ligase SUD1 [Papaver somniferum]
MQLGPVVHIVKFAFAVLASNVNILGAVIILPFSIGRIILHFMCRCSAATTAAPMFWMFSIAGLSVFASSSSQTGGEDGMRSQCCVGKPLVDSSSRPSDAIVLATGYMFLVSMVFFYLGIVAMLSYVKGQAVITGKLYGINYIANTITSLVRQYVKTMMYFVMSMVRVAFLLVVELGGFPLICGWWLDACTFRMLGKTLSLLAEFSSLTSSLIHWIVGIIYLLQIGVYAFGICDAGAQKLVTLKCIHLFVNY